MDLNTKVNIISGIIIPMFSIFGAIIGFFVGIYKERNNTKWKENREAIQCAYVCCEELKRSVNKKIPINTNLVGDLKNKWVNIKDKNIRNKVYNIVEFGIVDENTGVYIEKNVSEFIKCIDEILPKLLQELK